MKTLTIKEISKRLSINRKTASLVYHEMIDYYKPPSDRLLDCHFNDYFSVPTSEDHNHAKNG